MTCRHPYPVNEIFYSLQGEGFWTGTPALFIRFSGCNLHCPFCDTDFSESTPMDLGQILEKARECPAQRVILTGGEPSLQPIQPLIEALHSIGKLVHIETNGTCLLPEGIDWITLSPKEGSVVCLKNWDELKIVYTGKDPVTLWEPLVSRTESGHLFLQPCSGKNTVKTMEYILSDPRFRLSLQTHKLLDIR